MEATLARVNAPKTSGVSPSTIHRLSAEEVRKIDAYWRACNYLAVGMIYLRDNPLLREPLKAEHVKSRLLAHWGSSTGLSFTYVHLNRLIKKYDLNAIFMAGPGQWCTGRARSSLFGRHLFRDIPREERGRRRNARIL